VQEAVDTYDSRRQFQYAYGINDGLNPVQETSGATILANILPGLGIDEFLSRTDVVAGTTSNFLRDALGTPIAVTDSSGQVQTEYIYEPFGRTISTGFSDNSSYQYTGRENDGTGLYYYRNRFYNPQLQRFISEDPIGFGGGDVNLYAYVSNTPIMETDPLGLAGPWDKFLEWILQQLAKQLGKQGAKTIDDGKSLERGANYEFDKLFDLAVKRYEDCLRRASEPCPPPGKPRPTAERCLEAFRREVEDLKRLFPTAANDER
jgi:RHS repeat-associated protein